MRSMRILRLGFISSVLLVVAVISSASLGATPAVVSEAVVKCMVCEEEGDEHWFWPTTEESCQDPQYEPPFGECRACGGISQCHADAWEGPCHQECGIHIAAVARDLDSMFASLGREQESGRHAAAPMPEHVMRKVMLTPSLSVDPSGRVIELRDCGGLVVGEWPVPETVDQAI